VCDPTTCLLAEGEFITAWPIGPKAGGGVILARYILAEFSPPLLFGTIIFSFVFILDKLFDLVDLIFNRGVPVVTVMKLFGVFLPTILPLTFPMAILLATLISYGRLAQDGEVTAIRASGLSLWRITWPVGLLALVMSFGLIPFNRQLSPRAHAYFRRVFSQIVESDPLLQLEPRSFFEIRDLRLYAETVDKVHSRLGHVLLYKTRPDLLPPDRIFAKRGTYVHSIQNFQINLEDGQFERYDPKDPAKLVHIQFESYSINVPIGLGQADSSVDFRDLTSSELVPLLQQKKWEGQAGYEVESEVVLRYAVAFAPFAMALLGIPIGMILHKGGRTMGFGASAAILFGYYLILVLGLSLAEKGACPPWISIWGANFLCLGVGAILYYRMLQK